MSHKVYLAIPGPNICWGTVTGVINSTREHSAVPHNLGVGFSGVEDFNMLWADAHNAYERGEADCFAMLHGDISPAEDQFWLDILLEEMDKRQAALVSAVSPIKDGRGLTSCGIADLSDPWKPWRRFTIREIHTSLPETFDNIAAGYPCRPLLHNTGCWVCDLSHPAFHATSGDGALDLYFGFPTRAVRNAAGFWEHQRQSEDWLFSADLWNRGIRNTYITRRVRLVHHGKMDFPNHPAWGEFSDGDENTAEKWRKELDALPLRMLQIIDFELSADCNLGKSHAWCPNQSPARWAGLNVDHKLSDEAIVSAAVEAYTKLGFSGLVGWHYYNEPLTDAPRMFRLMRAIKAKAPAARFLLWTNGTLIPADCEEFREFSQIYVSIYGGPSRVGSERLTAKRIQHRVIQDAEKLIDNRLAIIDGEESAQPCLRPFVELAIDAYGNSHLCCYDWQGKATLGNLYDSGFAAIADRWRLSLAAIAVPGMTSCAPAFCRSCPSKWAKYQQHDEAIISRAKRWRESLAKEAACESV